MHISNEASGLLEERPEVLALLESFWEAMYRWETGCEKLHKEFVAGKITHKELKATIIPQAAAIFSQFCSYQGEPKRIRGGTYVFGSPPDYNPSLDTIETATSRKGGFELQVRTGGDFEYKYIHFVKLIDGQYKLLDKRMLLDEDGDVTSGL